MQKIIQVLKKYIFEHYVYMKVRLLTILNPMLRMD